MTSSAEPTLAPGPEENDNDSEDESVSNLMSAAVDSGLNASHDLFRDELRVHFFFFFFFSIQPLLRSLLCWQYGVLCEITPAEIELEYDGSNYSSSQSLYADVDDDEPAADPRRKKSSFAVGSRSAMKRTLNLVGMHCIVYRLAARDGDGCAGAVTFIVGTTIGFVDNLSSLCPDPATCSSGIFASPGLVLLHTHSTGLALVAWVIAGIVALLGGLLF